MFSCTTAQHVYCTNCTVCNWTELTVIKHKLPLHVQLHKSTAHLLYKLYSLQLNCTYSNYTQASACSAVQLESTFTVQIPYKLYSLQLNCTYSNYTEAAALCSAAQQHSTFTVQILYKLYSLQQNCTYSNYTRAAATCSAAEQHSTFNVQTNYKLYSLQLICTYRKVVTGEVLAVPLKCKISELRRPEEVDARRIRNRLGSSSVPTLPNVGFSVL